VAANLLEKKSGSASERDAVTLREFLRFRQFRQASKGFDTDTLIELVYGTQFGTTVASKLLHELDIKPHFHSEAVRLQHPLIRQQKLFLTDIVWIPLFRNLKDSPAELPLTKEQLRVASLVGVAIMTHRPVALFGGSGSGKTHVVETLAQAVGAPLRIIQFYADTDSAAIVGILEIHGDPKEVEMLRQEAQEIARSLVLSGGLPHLSLALARAAFSKDPDLDEIMRLLDNIAKHDSSQTKEADRLRKRTQLFQQAAVRNFIFKEGPLLEMMRT
jgi:hypothetical protein